MSSYLYYQLVGGEEAWVVTQADKTKFKDIRPTFITVLALDKIVGDKPNREFLESIKYVGPMYWDLDDANDVNNSIQDAKSLLEKLNSYGIPDTSINVFLSGKKGLHILVPQSVFMEKPGFVRFLPHIYKEIAFKMAEPTVDFRVYTARRGRMLRTCFNIRDNQKYKVAITADELRALTPEGYDTFVSTPTREYELAEGEFCARFALVYEEAAQKYTSRPRKAAKTVTPAQLKAQEPIALAIMNGETSDHAGFNPIAMQLAMYAREAGWNEGYFIEQCAGIIANHESDGSRYNSPEKRERALKETFYYMEDNPGYEYSIGGLKSVARGAQPEVDEEGNEVDSVHNMGVFADGYRYVTSKDENTIAITNFIFEKITKLVDPVDERILSYSVHLRGDANVQTDASLTLLDGQLSGSTSLHNAVSAFGGIFTGTDGQARGIQQLMLRAVDNTNYIIDSEGLNVINLPRSRNPALSKPFLVWADADGVRMPAEQKGAGINFTFQGFPEAEGVIKTDVTRAPGLGVWLNDEGNLDRLTYMLQNMISAYDPEVLGKTLGWMVSCFWRQLFHAYDNKFPLLHIYGPSGFGKTELATTLMRLFFYEATPTMITPSSTVFALQTLVAGSGSVPIVLDEYKPGVMEKGQLEKFRALFRDVYNMKDAQRGGGNAKKEAFNALSRVRLSGPIAFVAEAMETETAIVERIVLVSAKKPDELVMRRRAAHYEEYKQNSDILSILGHYIAARVLQSTTIADFKAEFSGILKEARNNHMLRQGDYELVESGAMTAEELQRRRNNKDRPVYNNSVALFGVRKFRKTLERVYKEDFSELFGEAFDKMEDAIFNTNEGVVDSTIPEYVKVLNTMGAMTRLEGYSALEEGRDFNVVDHGGQVRLVMDPRAVFAKYRSYMRSQGTNALYPSEQAFAQAMVDCPQYLGKGGRLERVDTSVILLDYEALQRSRVEPWRAKSKQFKT